MSWEYIKGNKNNLADFLSRYNLKENTEEKENNEILEEILMCENLARKPDKKIIEMFKNISKLQSEDSKLKNIIFRTNNKTAPKKYFLEENILYMKNDKNQSKLVLPETLLKLLIIELHEIYGHVGARKIYLMMHEDFYAVKLRHTVAKLISKCDLFQRTKLPTQADMIPAQFILPTAPNENYRKKYKKLKKKNEKDKESNRKERERTQQNKTKWR